MSTLDALALASEIKTKECNQLLENDRVEPAVSPVAVARVKPVAIQRYHSHGNFSVPSMSAMQRSFSEVVVRRERSSNNIGNSLQACTRDTAVAGTNGSSELVDFDRDYMRNQLKSMYKTIIPSGTGDVTVETTDPNPNPNAAYESLLYHCVHVEEEQLYRSYGQNKLDYFQQGFRQVRLIRDLKTSCDDDNKNEVSTAVEATAAEAGGVIGIKRKTVSRDDEGYENKKNIKNKQ